MTQHDYELLSQYLDGELPVTAVQALEQRLAAEPELRASLAKLRSLDESLKAAFRQPDSAVVPARIAALLERPRATVHELPRKRLGNWGFAMAASLLVAVSALLVSQWQGNPAPAGADTRLAAVLEQSPSRGDGWEALGDGRQVRPVLSFRSNNGQWCREFLVNAASSNQRGVACRQDGTWVSQVLVAEELADTGDQYRPAGAGGSDEVAAFMDDHAAGIALDAAQEAALIASQWQ